MNILIRNVKFLACFNQMKTTGNLLRIAVGLAISMILNINAILSACPLANPTAANPTSMCCKNNCDGSYLSEAIAATMNAGDCPQGYHLDMTGKPVMYSNG